MHMPEQSLLYIKYMVTIGKYVTQLPLWQYSSTVWLQALPHQSASILYTIAEMQEEIKVFYYFIASLALLC